MRTILLIALFVTLPTMVNAQMVLNEVAWMGSATDANNEWIELLNTSADAVDVTDWTIDDGNTLHIVLNGSVSGDAVALLERTDDESVGGVSAFHIYTGALSNSGATLTLRNKNGEIIDQVVGGEGWQQIGGDNITKETPQRVSSGWVTKPATPGVKNSTGDTQASSPEPKSENDQQKKVSGSTSKAPVRTTPTYSGVLELQIRAPEIAYVNQKITFDVVPEGVGPTIKNSLAYTWNFGDTYTASRKESTHIFEYPGEYVIMVGAKFGSQSAMARHEITVLPVSFSLARTEEGNLLITNNAPKEVDLGGFQLAGDASFTFPPFTILKPKGTLTIAKDRARVLGENIQLRDTEKMQVVALAPSHAPSSVVPYNRVAYAVPANDTRSALDEKIPDMTTVHAEELVVETIPTFIASSTIIQIGNTQKEIENGNFLARFFKRIAGIFE